MKSKPIEGILLLYVEDDKYIKEELELYLSRRFENVIYASNGKEGYELYLKYKPDIILTDVQMPEMSGLEMSKLIRQDDKKTPIIITSAHSDAKYLDEAIRIGINTFLLKPLSLIQLYFTLKVTSDNILLSRENQNTTNELNEIQLNLLDADKMANLGKLVAGFTHEINTPLGISFTSISHLESITKEIKENYKNDVMTQESFENYLDSCEKLSKMTYLNLERASQLIKSFNNIAVDQTHEEKREFNLKNYIEDIVFSLNYVVKKTNIEIKILCNETLIINSFPGYFSQILTNFIMNSIKHAYDENQKGLISIELEKEDKNLKIIYKDDGRGISQESLEKIFEPFYTTKRNNGGTGLGLSIVKDIVTVKLDGSISCFSKENEGITFLINIPLVQL